MSWAQQTDAPNETFIKAVGDMGQAVGRDHWAINCTAAITPRGIPHDQLHSLIRDSWVRMRFYHPSLAAYPDSSGANIVYTVPSSGEDLQEWASQTFHVVADAECAENVIADFAPSALARLYFVPRTNELVLHSTHWRTDGIGILLLMGQFLNLLVNQLAFASNRVANKATWDAFQSLAWGEEARRLTPSIEEAIRLQALGTPNTLHEQIANDYTGTFAHTLGAIGIPFEGDPTTRPAGTRSVQSVLDPQTTATIANAVKKKGLTVTAAINASVAFANHQLAEPEKKDRHYTSTVRLTLRPYLPELLSAPGMASGLYTTGWMAKVDPLVPWQSRALAYQTEYKKGYPQDHLLAHELYATRLCEVMKSPPPSDAEPPSDIDISSLGVVDTMVARDYVSDDSQCGLEVKSLNLGINMVTRQGILYVWTFRDQLNFSLVYNEAYHKQEQMRQFVNLVKDDLLQQLGIASGNP